MRGQGGVSAGRREMTAPTGARQGRISGASLGYAALPVAPDALLSPVAGAEALQDGGITEPQVSRVGRPAVKSSLMLVHGRTPA